LLVTGGLIAAGGWLWSGYTDARDRPSSAAVLANVSVTAHRPILIELYQSQGCSSCPPANANLNAIADRPDVVALSFAVTYWDQLGWKDRFAQPQFTARQVSYAQSHPGSVVATPQMWINGTATIVGSNARELAQVIAKGGRDQGPQILINRQVAEIAAAKSPAKAADVWLANYDPRSIDVAIGAGENRGRTLPHRNIVRKLTLIGHWSGSAVRIALPSASAGLRQAVFVQAGKGGPILAAAKT
jgi:hypothetical protein